MPIRITERQVCKKIIERKGDFLAEHRARGKQTMRYDPESFRTDMLSRDFIASQPTISCKWRMLQAGGVVKPDNGGYCIDIATLYLRAGEPVPPLVSANGGYTIIDGGEER